MSVPVGEWHFAAPYMCAICHHKHTVDKAVELNRRQKKGVRPAWGYYAPEKEKA